MNKIREHVKHLFRDIPDSERKEQLMQEITQNLEEKVQDLVARGKAEEDAVNKAIVDFGDIDDLKEELHANPVGSLNNTHSLGLAFSVLGSILIIALFLFINFYYSPNVVWCIYPIFAVLWWPLSMLFVYLRNRK